MGELRTHTIAPNGSKFSHRVWISFFLFYPLGLSLQKFMGLYCLVPMYVYTILLRKTKSRSNRKREARIISQWFWCKYFAHIFILYSKCLKKKQATYTIPKHSCILTSSSWCGVPMLRRKDGKHDNFTEFPHCVSGSTRTYWCLPLLVQIPSDIAVEWRGHWIVTKCDNRDKIHSFLLSIGKLRWQLEAGMQLCLGMV